MESNGELVIGAAGEVHLDVCLKDLRDRFARIPVSVSKPLVSFRESIANFKEEETEELDPNALVPKIIEGSIASGVVSFRLLTLALT